MEQLCKRFIVGKSWSTKTFDGQAIISEAALFLAILASKMAQTIRGVAGGAFSAMLEELGSQLFPAGLEGPNVQRFSELPEDIRSHDVWEIKNDEVNVIVIPRSSLTRIKFSVFEGVKVFTESQQFVLPVNPFAIGKMRRRFRSHGWLEA
jgi:hypothetical protein